ncbi:MAG: GntR family transcriptional regulator [Armatimonadota bacterium]
MIEMKLTENISETVYERLRDMIECGKLKPGMRLIQRDLARMLNTSSIPVAKAICRLEHDGLVVCELNRGAQVRDWSVDEIECAIMIRSSMEQIAAGFCAIRATTQQREKIKELAKAFTDCAIVQDTAGCLKADSDLHAFIVQCSGSQLLSRTLSNSRVITNTIRNATWLRLPVCCPSIHDSLVDAIISGDEELAKDRAREHVEEVLSDLCRVMHESMPRPKIMQFA